MSTTKSVSAALSRYIMPLSGIPASMGTIPSKLSQGAPTTIDMSGAGGSHVYSWDATFTPAQEAEWEASVVKAQSRERPPDEAVVAQFDVLRSYADLANPSGPQTTAALRAVIAVLREMWRE
jgi:hypothetical protein